MKLTTSFSNPSRSKRGFSTKWLFKVKLKYSYAIDLIHDSILDRAFLGYWIVGASKVP